MFVLGDPVKIRNAAGIVSLVVPPDPSFKLQLAADLIRARFEELTGRADVLDVVSRGRTAAETAQTIHLVIWQRDKAARGELKVLDREDLEVLRDPMGTEQSYVIRVEESEVVLVGSTDQGVLFAATTLIQLMESRDGLA